MRRWIFLGYDRETIRRYGAEIDRANLRTIQRMCLLALMLVALRQLYRDPTVPNFDQVFFAVLFALFLVVSYLYY